MKKLLLTLIVAGLCFAQGVAISTAPDITGSASTVVLLSTHRYARTIQIVAPTTNTSAIRWGDTSTTSTRGAVIPPGNGQFFPQIGLPYDLNTIYVYVASGDKVSISWVNF